MPGVLEAIRAADAIVLAPGSLYTSLIPNLLVAGVADAIRRSAAVKILVCNLMTQPGETDGFSASDHLRVVEQSLGRNVVEFCVVNSALPQQELPTLKRERRSRSRATSCAFVLSAQFLLWRIYSRGSATRSAITLPGSAA